MKLKDLEIVDTDQQLYDCFNEFILSRDTKVFGKLLARSLLLDQVKGLPGDIVECGVFKGSGLLTFLKLKQFLCPGSGKKVIGFDFFDTTGLVASLDAGDKEAMHTLFKERGVFHEKERTAGALGKLIRDCGFSEHDFELIAGDISDTAPAYVEARPGFRISLLYMDLDLEEPTFDALNALWPRVVRGGIVVFDEYAYHAWSESEGADRFFLDKGITLQSLNYLCPSACVVKS